MRLSRKWADTRNKYNTKSGSVGKLSSQWDEEELAKETEKE